MSDAPREFCISGYIDDDAAALIIGQLQEAHLDSDAADWFIVLSSPGGEIEAGTAVYEVIKAYSQRSHGTHVVTMFIVGQCCSMATLIAQAGDYRITTRLTQWMFHDLQVGCSTGESMTNVKSSIASLDEWSVAADEEMLSRTNMNLVDYSSEISKGDWYVRGGELLTLGFVDEIR